MTYLLDADWIISFLNGRREAVDLVRDLSDNGIAVSVIAYGEISEGLLGTSSLELRRSEFDTFIGTVDLLAPTVEIAKLYAKIRFNLRQEGLSIPDNDVWIAATALAHDLILVSRDVHFSRVADLRLFHQHG